MSFSLNEVDAMAKRATRGVGYAWGLAEEAGKATRWLCAHSLDGVSVLAATLEDDPDPSSCPLIAGTALSDKAADLTDAPLTLIDLSQPMLLLAFAGSAARQLGHPVTLTCNSVVAVTDGSGLALSGTFPIQAKTVDIRLGGQMDTPLQTATRVTPDQNAWATLERFAHRTYAPATEESRRLGAGAGLSDND
ncbi:DUF3726 domain-containing protein [Phaeobacter marinintestinus]|uniref:DUF3726 domain-containing protein n=1 Tax=Falsiphaeobacter marinintestinus TaxID=1492905 RepID=UPI0011B6E0EA|nr:DUF3726 domain-containing protein [Phaeobacter marinintestinus]